MNFNKFLGVFCMLICVSSSMAQTTLKCYLNNEDSTGIQAVPFNGQAVACIWNDPEVTACTKEKFPFRATADQMYQCTRGNQKATGYRVIKDNAQIFILPDNSLVDGVPATQLYLQAGPKCVGFYTGLVYNPNLGKSDMEKMFQELVACHIIDTIDAKAQANALTLIGLVSDLVMAIDAPAAIAAGLVIKVIIAGVSVMDNPKDNDYLQFLSVYKTILQIDLQCGNQDLKTCLAKSNVLVTKTGSYKLSITSCSGESTSDTYLVFYSGGDKSSGGTKVLTTGASWIGSSPVDQLCKGSRKDPVFYTKVQIDAGKPLCVESWERKTGIFGLNPDLKQDRTCIDHPHVNSNEASLKCYNQKIIKLNIKLDLIT